MIDETAYCGIQDTQIVPVQEKLDCLILSNSLAIICEDKPLIDLFMIPIIFIRESED